MSYSSDENHPTGHIVVIFNALQGEHPDVTLTPSPTPGGSATPEPGWEAASYSYGAAHPHAVVQIERATATDAFGYIDAGLTTPTIRKIMIGAKT